MTGYDWLEALSRMKRAEAELTNLAAKAERDGVPDEQRRLLSKREGVRLARSYLEEVEQEPTVAEFQRAVADGEYPTGGRR